jgi:hypothetical protein
MPKWFLSSLLQGLLLLGLAHCDGTAVPHLSPADAAKSPADAAACNLDAALQSFAPSDPHIEYVGRLDLSDDAGPVLIQSAAYLRTKFWGPAAYLQASDNPSNGGADFFDVSIDGNTFSLSVAGGTSFSLAPADNVEGGVRFRAASTL